MTVRGQTGVSGLAIIGIVCAGGEMTNWDMQTVRARLRLASGLTLMAFVTMHMMAHVALLVSFEWADTALAFLMAPWRTMPGTVLLAAAFLAHYANALWSIYFAPQPAHAAMGAVAGSCWALPFRFLCRST